MKKTSKTALWVLAGAAALALVMKRRKETEQENETKRPRPDLNDRMERLDKIVPAIEKEQVIIPNIEMKK